MFWEMFGKKNYNIDDNDFSVSNIITSTVISYDGDYLETVVIGQEKPDEAAFNLYGSTEYFWILLVVNNIVNPFTDWVMTNDELASFCISKYGEDNLKKAHHYINDDEDSSSYGKEYDYDTSNLITTLVETLQTVPSQYKYITVTNFDYEAEINGKKSTILAVPKRNLFSFIDMYQSSVRALTPED